MGAVGGLFGPIILVWFLTIGVLGVIGLASHPQMLAAYGMAATVTMLSPCSVVMAFLGTTVTVIEFGALYRWYHHSPRSDGAATIG